MIKFAANPHRTALFDGSVPDGPLTPRQRRIVDAVRWCGAFDDFVVIETRRRTIIEVASIDRHDPNADQSIQSGLIRARIELERLEGIFRAYGSDPFSPISMPVPANCLKGETRHEIYLQLMRYLDANGYALVRAGDTPIVRMPDGGYDIPTKEIVD